MGDRKKYKKSTEMKSLRIIHETDVKTTTNSNIQDIHRYTKDRRKYWNDHIERMGVNRFIKQAKPQKPEEGRVREVSFC